MSVNNILQWIAIVISLAGGLWSVYLHFKKKAKLRITVEIKQFDHNKRLNVSIHPINELIVSIVNTSTCPCTIKNILFRYHADDEQTQNTYDNFSHKKRKQVLGKTLMKSEEESFSLSYLDEQEKHVIDNLKEVIVVSTYGHQYPLESLCLKSAIEKVKKLPSPDPINLSLNFEKK